MLYCGSCALIFAVVQKRASEMGTVSAAQIERAVNGERPKERKCTGVYKNIICKWAE